MSAGADERLVLRAQCLVSRPPPLRVRFAPREDLAERVEVRVPAGAEADRRIWGDIAVVEHHDRTLARGEDLDSEDRPDLVLVPFDLENVRRLPHEDCAAGALVLAPHELEDAADARLEGRFGEQPAPDR